jgi:hypothetical protein
MRIIFLDIDGVLNTVDTQKGDADIAGRVASSYILKSKIKLLNKLTDETGAKIVWTASARLILKGRIGEIMISMGVTAPSVGETIALGNHCVRGNEIKAWISDNQTLLGAEPHNFNQFVIIDDESDMLYGQRNNFIHIDMYAGLSEHKCHLAKRKLLSLINILQ